jgi:hypothetical protein
LSTGPISDERLLEIVRVRRANSPAAAALILGLAERTVREHMVTAARRGLLGYDPVLPGFEVSRISTRQDEGGHVTQTNIQQRPERANSVSLDPSQEVRGVSSLVDSEGRIVQQWIKSACSAKSDSIESIKEAFKEYDGASKLCSPPEYSEDDLLTSYVIGDHHLGMYAWKDETGHDYDLDIGEHLLRRTMSQLVSRTSHASTALIISLGDFFHTDSSNNTTSRSSNALDVDTRRAKVVKIGVKLMIQCIEMALQKHGKVIVRCLPGNHDQETTPILAIALWAFFHNNPRVEVDTTASRFFHYEFGLNMISGTHGDMAKIFEMPGIMAANCPDMWGRTRFRYAYAGHIHHKEKFCRHVNGALCETFEVLPPTDAWHSAMGFGSGRSMTAIDYHRRRGEVLRHTANVAPEIDKV